MKRIANIMTSSRIIGSFVLLVLEPLSGAYYTVYALCVVSDALDGTVARKTKTESKSGEVLDTIADIIFILAILYTLLPVFEVEPWMLVWAGVILGVHAFSALIGFLRFRAWGFLHTYSNKASGAATYSFPVLVGIFGITAAVTVICVISTLAAIEALIIILRTNHLDRNIVGIWYNEPEVG